MTTLSEYFDQFLRERVYFHNITPKTREFCETAWKALAPVSNNHMNAITRWAILLTVAFQTILPAQTKPDFTGVWTLKSVSDATARAADQLGITTVSEAGLPVIAVERRYKDEVEVEMHQVGVIGGMVGGASDDVRGGARTPRTERSVTWRGDKLVIARAQYSGRDLGPFYEYQEVWSLVDGVMVIDITNRDSDVGLQRISYEYQPSMSQR